MRISYLLTAALMACAAPAIAKLPPPTPEAKAKADETAARQAWSAKQDGYQLCQSQNKVVDAYRASAQAKGLQVQPALPTPDCTDPGPFKYVAKPQERPLEAGGAHSPAETAARPHNEREPDNSTKNPGASGEAVKSNGPATVTTPATTPTPETTKR